MTKPTPESIDFDAPDLASRLAGLDPRDLDTLPFGVVRLGPAGEVLFFSERERELSGYPKDPVGLNWLRDVAPCMNEPWFNDGLKRARDIGRLDIVMRTTGDYRDPGAELDIRLLSAAAGRDLWLLVRRA